MTDEEHRVGLSDRQGRGVVIAIKGFRFQAAYIVSQIPVWLDDPDFFEFVQEGACDMCRP